MLINNYKKKISIFYAVIVTLNFIAFYCNDILLSQYNPILFYNRLDVTTNLLLLLNIKSAVLNSTSFKLVFDTLFLLLPISVAVAININFKFTKLLTVFCIVFCFGYGLIVALFCTISLEFFMPYFFIPLLFYALSEKGFYYAFWCARLLFAMFFLSAAFWKLRTGAIFNTEQMSAILIYQHKQLLVELNTNWYTEIITYLINNKGVSYSLYLLGFLSELLFILAFFTKKYDKILALALLLFVAFDFGLMQINYTSWLCFLPLFYYSNKVKEPLI